MTAGDSQVQQRTTSGPRNAPGCVRACACVGSRARAGTGTGRRWGGREGGGECGECRLVSVPLEKGYYANDPRKTRRGNSATQEGAGRAERRSGEGGGREGGAGRT